MKICFEGRGFKNPVMRVTVCEGGLLLRADCKENGEAWATLFLPFEDVMRLFRLTVAVEKVVEQEKMRDTMLEDLTRLFPGATPKTAS